MRSVKHSLHCPLTCRRKRYNWAPRSWLYLDRGKHGGRPPEQARFQDFHAGLSKGPIFIVVLVPVTDGKETVWFAVVFPASLRASSADQEPRRDLITSILDLEPGAIKRAGGDAGRRA